MRVIVTESDQRCSIGTVNFKIVSNIMVNSIRGIDGSYSRIIVGYSFNIMKVSKNDSIRFCRTTFCIKDSIEERRFLEIMPRYRIKYSLISIFEFILSMAARIRRLNCDHFGHWNRWSSVSSGAPQEQHRSSSQPSRFFIRSPVGSFRR